ncbi:hypothetical protein ABT127_11090 [Streptomyces sp. NPDC001904]|uniref:hypothetical protein n=1 Tax=Streptomyces sp. NPDC001904 TaxID=3154531 RepID=UPI00331BD402
MLEWESVSDAVEGDLYRELYEGLPGPIPDLGREGSRPTPVGVVAAREAGKLMGWAEVYASETKGGAAVLQWLLIERERRRISSGFNTEHPGSPAEIELLSALASQAADRAREAGCTTLRWWPAEPGFAEGVAASLGAEQVVDAEGWRSYRLHL